MAKNHIEFVEFMHADVRQKVLYYLSFLIWPFGMLIAAIKYNKKQWAKNIFLLFCMYFGFVFIYSDPYRIGGADSARYAKQLIDLHNNPVSFGQILSMLYNPKEGLTDIYQPIVTWLVSVFSGDPRVLFMVFGAVFGYFWLQNIWIIFSNTGEKKDIMLLLLIMGFALINPIWNINGVRMWTAAQIFLYGALIYLFYGKKKGLIFILLSVPVHFSFMFPAALFLVYIILPDLPWIFFIFFVAASFIREINLSAVRDSLSFLPDVFQPKVEAYTNVQYARAMMESSNELSWHIKFADTAGRFFVYAWTFIAFATRRKWISLVPEAGRILSLALFIGGFAQIASLVPSGGRFMTIANSLFYFIFIIFHAFAHQGKIVALIKYISIPLLLYVVIFAVRVGFDYTGFTAVFGNPVLSLFIKDQTPLIDIVKQIF